MTADELDIITLLREQNYPYSFIAKELGRSLNTVKSACLRKGIRPKTKRKTKAEKAAAPICKYCHKPLPESKRSDSKFCSSNCRVKWRRQNIKIT